MPQFRTDTYHRMTHVSGPGCVMVSLRFGAMPSSGPLVTLRVVFGSTTELKLNVEHYISEVLEGVAEANQLNGTSFEVEEVEIIPNDYPTKGQVRRCAKALAAHLAAQESSHQPTSGI